MIFETDRLILRPWCEDDAEDLYEYARDKDVGPAAGWPVHTSVENSRGIIKNVLSVPETYAVCLKNGRAIGSVGLKTGEATDMTDRADECELGYWLGKPYWGQGIIPDAVKVLIRHAFENLGMRAVWCGHYDGNGKSRRVMEKLGFVYHHTTDCVEVPLLGEIRKGHVMLMTKEEWERRKSKNMLVSEKIKQLFKIVNELESRYPEKKFTVDGHLLGSIGEVLVSEHYGLTLLPNSTKTHDAISIDGRLVQIKATQTKQISISSEPDYLIVIRILDNAEWEEVYNGRGQPVWENCGKVQKNGQRQISINKLQELMKKGEDKIQKAND